LEDNMNIQERMIDKRTFRIAVIAVAAAVLLAAAAYLFGTGLRADTSASVAPSPLGSSLTDVRQARVPAPVALSASSLDARGARTIVSAAKAASLAALAKSRSDFYGDLNAAAAASRWASVAARDQSLARFYMAVNATNAAADASRSASLVANPAEFSSNQSVWALTEAARATNRPESSSNQSVWALTARSASLAKSRSDSYGDLNNSPAAVDPYQNEWMGFASPESVDAK
jgi:hypothetical protein